MEAQGGCDSLEPFLFNPIKADESAFAIILLVIDSLIKVLELSRGGPGEGCGDSHQHNKEEIWSRPTPH
jgi:hypothetical protein